MAILCDAPFGILLADIDADGKLVETLCNNNGFDGAAFYCSVKNPVCRSPYP